MGFHALPIIAYYGAKEAFKYAKKKLTEREAGKAREQNERDQEEGAQVCAAGADKRARDAAEAHIKELQAELKEAQRRERERIEEEERLEAKRIEDARIAGGKRKADEAAAKEREAKEKERRDAEEKERKAAEEALAQKNAEIQVAKEELEKERKEREEIHRKLKEAEDALLRGIPPEVLPTRDQLHQFRKKYGYQDNKLHVAVVGESGTGKSTFINAIRGLSSGEAGSATSSINECNATVTRYEDPRHTDLVWYDVPGSNTATVTCWSYFMDQGLFAFDALVLVFSNRFTQTVSTVLKNAKTCNKPVFLVRTMADQIMANFRVDTGNQLASDDDVKSGVVEMTRGAIRKNMELISMPIDIEFYLVSREALTAYSKAGQILPSMIHEQDLMDAIYANKKVGTSN